MEKFQAIADLDKLFAKIVTLPQTLGCEAGSYRLKAIK